jgi:hypothetical protein
MARHEQLSRSWISVNEALDRLDELEGQPVEIYGLLSFERDDHGRWHFPKAERHAVQKGVHTFDGSRIWVAFNNGSIQPNIPVISRWHGRRVAIFGVHNGPPKDTPWSRGRSYMSLWLAEIVPYSIERM